jgi:hypothetical protein
MKTEARKLLEALIAGSYLGDSDNHYGVRGKVTSQEFSSGKTKNAIQEIEEVTKGNLEVTDLIALPSLFDTFDGSLKDKALSGMIDALKRDNFLRRAKRETMNCALIHTVGEWDRFYEAATRLNEEREALK